MKGALLKNEEQKARLHKGLLRLHETKKEHLLRMKASMEKLQIERSDLSQQNA